MAERFSYYGMMGILELYLVNRMRMGEHGGTEVLHLFGTAVYFLPLLGGWLADRRRFPGQVVLSYTVGYSVIRFVLEFWRGDLDRGSFFGGALSTSQLIAIVLVLGAAALWPRLSRKGLPAPAAA